MEAYLLCPPNVIKTEFFRKGKGKRKGERFPFVTRSKIGCMLPLEQSHVDPRHLIKSEQEMKHIKAEINKLTIIHR